jgi:hypothetical protein
MGACWLVHCTLDEARPSNTLVSWRIALIILFVENYIYIIFYFFFKEFFFEGKIENSLKY